MAAINRYPLWKYLLILVVIIAAFIYAAPNLYGDDPAVQVVGANAIIVDNKAMQTIVDALQKNSINYKSVQFRNQILLFRFNSTDDQLKAKDIIQQALGDNYLVALNLAPATPAWLTAIGAVPM